MSIKVRSSGVPSIRSPLSELPFTNYEFEWEPSGGSEVDVVVDDRVVRTISGASNILTGILVNGLQEGSQLISHTPLVITPNAPLNRFDVVSTTPGDQFLGDIKLTGFKTGSVAGLIPTPPAVTTTIASLVPGTLAGDTHSALRALMIPGAQSADTRLFTTFPSNPVSGGFARSLTHWLSTSTFDFTGCVAATSAPQQPKGKRGGALITPRVVAWCRHFGGNGPGTKVYFVTDEGVKIERTIISDITESSLDLKLSLLDSDLPSEIAVYPLCPDLSSFRGSGGWASPRGGPACLWVDAWGPEAVYHCGYMGPTSSREVTANGTPHTVSWGGFYHGTSAESPNSWTPPIDSWEYYAYTKGPIGGDSGSPVFLAESGRLIYLSSWTGSGSGPSSEGAVNYFNDKIVDLFNKAGAGTPQTATEAIVSGYTTYD